MEELSVEQAKAFIENVAKENSEFYGSSRGRGALRDLQQSFPHHWIYVAELLQNAVDEKAKSIHFTEPKPGVVVLEHDGKAFDEKDVEGICTKGVSSKGAGTVGFMGVGFKAVFRSFETVSISSGPWRFRLCARVTRGSEYGDLQREWMGAVLPKWDDSALPPSKGMACRFELRDRIERVQPILADFQAVFREDNALMALLATREVNEVQLFGTTWLLSVEEHAQAGIAARCVISGIDDKTETLKQWMLFRADYEPSREAVRRFLEHRAINPAPEDREHVYGEAARKRRVELFFPLDQEGFPDLPEKGEAFALLPTMQKLPFGVHVNADWLLTVTRMEFMDVEQGDNLEGNEWQKEIRKRIPELVRGYISWLGSNDGLHSGLFKTAYNVFPGSDPPQDRFGAWILGGDLEKSLRESITSVLFLPSLHDQSGKVSFLSPVEGRVLPPSFATGFEKKKDLLPWDLFGYNIVSRSTLGERACEYLLELGVLQELSASELASKWGDSKVKEWFEQLSEENRNPGLYTLIKSLSEIPESSWLDGELICIPTEGLAWVSRKRAIRLPADWGILVNEPHIAEMLLPFVGESDCIVNRQFENYVRSQHYSGWIPNLPVVQKRLEDVVAAWWKSLPEKGLDSSQIEDIVAFTCWVEEKQKSRRALVQKLLSTLPDGSLALMDIDEVLLADPYAGNFRRVFLAGISSVAAAYYQHTPKDADWKSFLEGFSPRPKGRFQLDPGARSLDVGEAQRILKERPPDTRVTSLRQNWDRDPSVTVSNVGYVLVEFSLNEDIAKELARGGEGLYLTSLAQWMNENTGPLREFTRQRLLYIPYGYSNIAEITLDLSARWISQLREHLWVIAKDGSGPYRPSDVLKRADPSRPSAPVADLSPELISVLEQAGVLFGASLPEAEAIRRLQFEGPSASLDVLHDLLESANSDLDGDQEKKRELANVLESTALFPVPQGTRLIDRSRRVTGSRCVLHAGPGYRSDLNWVVPLESFEEGSLENKIVALAKQVYVFRTRISAGQCMDFLELVWGKQPEADSVRHLLPRAYSYIAEDIRTDSGARERWEVIRAKARIYTLGRVWKAVQGADSVYYDDLGVAEVTQIVPRSQLATPGHLGLRTDGPDAPEGVPLLNLPLLSNHYKVEKIEGDEVKTPEQWRDRFKEVQNLLQKMAAMEDLKGDREETRTTLLPELRLRVVTEIARLIVKASNHEELQRYNIWAEVSGNVITVAGSPSDFAAALCRILLDHFGINGLEDPTLPTEVAVLIVLLDSDDFKKHLQSIQARFGMPAPGDESKAAGSGDFDGVSGSDAGHAEPTKNGAGTEVTKEPSGKSTKNGGGEDKAKPEGATSDKDDPTKGTEGKGKHGGTGTHTAADRERMIAGLLKRAAELKAFGLNPEQPGDAVPGEPQTDDRFRDAVVSYEKACGRFPVCKDPYQSGHDIDSFTSPPDIPGRQLLRRIEVKGRSHPWEGEQTVELSRPQFEGALQPSIDGEVDLALDFEHWVYVVEDLGEGRYRVLPTRNPARNSRKFELRGGTWRHFVEEEGEVVGEKVEIQSEVGAPRRRSIRDLRDTNSDELEENYEEEDE
jgi:hypothetical protein